MPCHAWELRTLNSEVLEEPVAGLWIKSTLSPLLSLPHRDSGGVSAHYPVQGNAWASHSSLASTM